MPAPQQTMVPTYKETANIPRANVAYYLHDERDSPGYALARLLKAVPGAVKKHQQVSDEANEVGPNEKAQLMALAQMGADRDRLRVAKGSSMFGLLKSNETTLDAYNVERGRREADLFAGQLRTAYAESGLNHNSDPKAFAAFAEAQKAAMFEKLGGTDEGYYHGFITRVGPIFEEMAEAHAGYLDDFLQSENKQAFKARAQSRMDRELSVRRERDSFGAFMDSIMGAESGGNYNAFHRHGNNSSIKFTDMTVGEVLEWQSSKRWKDYGAGSSAVGKYQFIESTLRETVRDAGISLDTKFTPGVQDKLIYVRLAKHRGLQKFLDGEITAEQFLDSGLAREFAGLKKTSGAGHYDKDGLNKATHSAKKTIAALLQFRDAWIKDPTKAPKTDSEGNVVIDAEDQKPDRSMATMLDTVEEDFGVSQKDARSSVADHVIERMEENVELAEREDLEDLMAEWKLSKADRKRVMEARDRVIAERDQKAALEDDEKTSAIVSAADRFIRGDDKEALGEVKASNPKVYEKLLARVTNPVDPETVDNDGFLEGADYDNSQFPRVAMKAFADGDIDAETYARAMDLHELRASSRPVMKMPGIREVVANLKRSLPGVSVQKTFEDQLAIQIADMTRANGGERPTLLEITQAAQQLHQTIAAMHQQEAQARMMRPEYQSQPDEG